MKHTIRQLIKHLKMKVKLIIVFYLLFISITAIFGQNKNVFIKVCNDDTFINDSTKRDTIYADVKYLQNGIDIRLYNNTSDTVYLFNSYIDSMFYRAKYLHHYDKRKHKHTISFLPIFPYIGVKYSDLVTLGANRLVKQNQVLYAFTEILPSKSVVIHFSNDLLKPQGFVKGIDLINIDRYSKFKYKTLKYKNINIDVTVVQFAIYQNINLLNNETSFYLDEFNFNRESKSYSTISATLK